MVISVREHYKLHICLFTSLSFQLFILVPIPFINKFLAVAACIGVLLNIKEIKFEFERWREIIVFVLLNSYLTFAIFGYDLFLAPQPELLLNLSYFNSAKDDLLSSMLDMAGPYLGIFYFGLGFIWTSYILQSFLDVIKSLGEMKDRLCFPSNDKYWKKWIILFAIMAALFMLWQQAFNPIVLSPDSWGYLGGWHTGSYNSFRSPVYAFLIYIICSIAPTTPEVQWIAIVQNLAFSSLLATVLMYLHKGWIKFKYMILSAIILPLIPSLGLHTIVVWCDLACGMSLLWFTYAMVRIIDEVIISKTATQKQQLSFCIQLCISMILSYFIRSNSFLVYLIMAPTLILLFIFMKQWRLLTSVALSVIMVLLIQFPGYTALHVQSRSDEHKYYAAMHDIQAAYYGGGNLSEQTQTTLRKYILKLDDPDARAAFKPYVVQYGASVYNYSFSELTMNEFISMYTDAFVHNPFKMLNSMFFRVRAYWVIDAKRSLNGTNYTDIYDGSTGIYGTQAPEIGVYRQRNFLTGIMYKYMLGMALPLPATFLWRFGIWTALMVISIATLILQKRYIWILAYIPIFTYLATLFLTSGWTDYRYGLPVFFVGMFLPLTLILLRPTNTAKEKV